MITLSNWVHSFAGGIHFAAAVIGMLSGIFVLSRLKGPRLHKIMGYVFVVSLVLVNLSALFIYDFNDGTPSVFHVLIPVSLFFLCFGFIPMLGKRKPNALNRHIIGMNGAVYGLWAAGATEYFVREIVFTLDLNPNQLIAMSFAISTPFAVAIAVSIVYFQRQHLTKMQNIKAPHTEKKA